MEHSCEHTEPVVTDNCQTGGPPPWRFRWGINNSSL